MFGVEIKLKTGGTEWIDPVSDEPNEENGILTVTNKTHSYEYALNDISNWSKYDLCKRCFYDVRSYDCTDDECFNLRYVKGD